MTMRIHAAGILVLSLALGGCGSEAALDQQLPTAGLCESHAGCPPTQICSAAGACEVTCLTSSICASNASISGALTVETLHTDALAPVSIHAAAAFLATDTVPEATVAAVPGTECRLIPRSQMQLPAGLSVGPITIACAKETAGASDATILNPTDPGESGTMYEAEISEQLPLNTNHPIQIHASGELGGDFSVGLVTPEALENIAFVIHDTDDELSARTISWTPGTSSQVVLMATPVRSTAEPVADDLVLMCPARDEAGSIHVPADALSALDADDIHFALSRRNLTNTTPGADGLPIAAVWTYRWKENLRTATGPRTPERSE
jgi:hypothetical protein